jgi:hypothetical protein
MDRTGMKYGHLTFIDKADKGINGEGALWNVRCDCGNVSQKRAKYVAAGRVKTCGKCELSVRLMTTRGPKRPTGDKAMQKLYNDAMSRGLTAGLDYTSYTSIITQKCTFCGKAPRQKNKGPKIAHNEMCWDVEAKLVTGDDCYAICTECRIHKGRSKPSEYLDYLIRCVQNLTKYMPT